jgi:hypothetical protein
VKNGRRFRELRKRVGGCALSVESEKWKVEREKRQEI